MSESDIPAVHDLARTGRIELAEVLECGDISKSISMSNLKDKHSRTPLHLAAFSGHIDSVRTLISFKAEVDNLAMDGFTALHFACQAGHFEVAKLLIDAKANVSRCLFKSKRSPLHMACAKNYQNVVELLIKRGVDCSLKTRQGQTALDLIKDPTQRKDVEQLISLKGNGKRSNSDFPADISDEKDHKIKKVEHDNT